MPLLLIDQRLITIKLFYFLTLSALATLLPYLPIFLTQIGLKPTELAVIYCLIFFTTFFKNILVGFIADKYQLHKPILILSCILSGPLYATLLAVPPIPREPELLKSSTISLRCSNSSMIANLSELTPALYSNVANESVTCLSSCEQQLVGCPKSSQICEISCKPFNINIYLPSSIHNESQQSYSERNVLKPGELGNNSALQNFDLSCHASYNCEYSKVQPPHSSSTFWLCLVIGLLAALCGSNELMMNDAIAISILGDDRRKWGRSRLWGSAGYGMCALLVSLLIERLGSGNPVKSYDIDYTPAFYVYLVLSLSSGIVAYFHPTGQIVKSSQVLKGMRKILGDCRIVVFLSLILLLGFYNGITITYAYLYLKTELHASQLCIGLCVFTTVLVEFPILFIGGKIVDKIGTMACLYLALIAYCARFLGYVYIPSPWWALLVETSHMFTFGLMYTAANMHAGKVTTKGNTGTMIGLINGIKWGLGLGLGSLLGGIFADRYQEADGTTGFRFLFLCSGISCAVLLVIYVILNELILERCCPVVKPLDADVDDAGDAVKFTANCELVNGNVKNQEETSKFLEVNHNETVQFQPEETTLSVSKERNHLISPAQGV